MAGDESKPSDQDGPYFPPKTEDHHYGGARGIIAREHDYLSRWRQQRSPGADPGALESSLVGLALSGGGIRSASFCLGVIQALARTGWMKRLDYLSTVSGGGYSGTALSWLLHQQVGGERVFGLEPGNFPFGTRRQSETPGFANTEETGEATTSVGMGAVLYWLRQHANFLVPGHGINLAALVGVFLGNVVVSLAVYFPLICLAYYGLMVGASALFDGPAATSGSEGAGPGLGMLRLGLASLAVMLVLSLAYAVGSFFFREKHSLAVQWSGLAFWLRTWWARTMGFLLMLGVFVLVAASAPYLVDFLGRHLPEWLGDKKSLSAVLGAISALLGMLPARGAYTSKHAGDSWLLLPVVTWVGAMLLLYGLVLLADVTVMAATAGQPPESTMRWWGWAALLVPFVVGATADLNSVSMHRYYRDRLMGSFMPQPAGVEEMAAGGTQADSTRLHEMCDRDKPYAPLHLINTNVVLVDAKGSRNKGRGGDSFVLSALHCGSSATGWRATAQFMGGSVTLASAIFFSGFAIWLKMWYIRNIQS